MLQRKSHVWQKHLLKIRKIGTLVCRLVWSIFDLDVLYLFLGNESKSLFYSEQEAYLTIFIDLLRISSAIKFIFYFSNNFIQLKILLSYCR